jgi:hypothetical protein
LYRTKKGNIPSLNRKKMFGHIPSLNRKKIFGHILGLFLLSFAVSKAYMQTITNASSMSQSVIQMIEMNDNLLQHIMNIQ